RQGFGMTELGCAMTTPEGKERLGSVGTLAPSLLCVIRDINTGENLGPYKRGEICIKGPTIMKGYYKNEKATKETFTEDGWMKTGDIAYYDEDEYFFVVDRIKELIKYKGFQIAPAELEQILLTNPKIHDAGVIGIPNEDCGEIPLAFVVKQSSANLCEAEVHEHLARFVSKNKYLYGGVRFVDEIPRTPSGKILRKELKKLLARMPSKL
ncbi:AMP-binding protein, partial [Oryctes borbonicus]